MEDNFEELVHILSTTSLSNDVISRLTFIIKQQIRQNDSSFISQSLESLFILERWVWQLFTYDSNQWISLLNYSDFFQTLASFNRNLIRKYDDIEAETKALILIPNTMDQINKVFEQINHSYDDNDPCITVISLWFDNFAFFMMEYSEYNTLTVIYHTNQYIAQNYIMTEKFKYYLSQLEQTNVPQSIFTRKQLFFIKTCSLLLSTYVTARLQNFVYTAQDVMHHIGEQYFNIIRIHSYTMESWSKEQAVCITYLTRFVFACFWWSREQIGSTKTFFLTEPNFNELIEGFIRIISYQPFTKEIQNDQYNNEGNLIETILMFFLLLLQTDNMNHVFHSNVLLSDILLNLTENSSSERISVCAYAILCEISNDEKLKELRITNEIYQFFMHIIEQRWHHPLRKYPQSQMLYLLRGKYIYNHSSRKL